MEVIVRDGIRVPIPAAITSEGGRAVEAYVAAIPSSLFPPVPAELREPKSGTAYDAFIAELASAGALSSFQEQVDQWIAANHPKADAAPAPAAPAEPPEVVRGRELAQRALEALTAPAVTPPTAPTPPAPPAPSFDSSDEE